MKSVRMVTPGQWMDKPHIMNTEDEERRRESFSMPRLCEVLRDGTFLKYDQASIQLLQLTSLSSEFVNKSGLPSASKFYLQVRLWPCFPFSISAASDSSLFARLRFQIYSLLSM